MDDDFRMHRGDEEVILVLCSEFSRMRQPEEIELTIMRPDLVLAGGERRVDRARRLRCA